MNEQTYEPGRWSLTDLLKSPIGKDLEKFTARLEEVVVALEGWRDRLSEGISKIEFAKIVSLIEEIGALSRRLWAYTSLYDMITTRFAFRVKIDGEGKVLTRSKLMVSAATTSTPR